MHAGDSQTIRIPAYTDADARPAGQSVPTFVGRPHGPLGVSHKTGSVGLMAMRCVSLVATG